MLYFRLCALVLFLYPGIAAAYAQAAVMCVDGTTPQDTHCYIRGDIKPPDDYLAFSALLNKKTTVDTVHIHLAGNGGNADGLVYLLNAINRSKAKIISEVDGSVASADAILALAGQVTNVNGDGFFWWHSVSSSHMNAAYCAEASGVDRGLPVYEKCMENGTKTTDIYNKVIDTYARRILTPTEYKLYQAGHDVIFSLEELKKRIKYSTNNGD